jgi:hypothetical protein
MFMLGKQQFAKARCARQSLKFTNQTNLLFRLARRMFKTIFLTMSPEAPYCTVTEAQAGTPTC